MKKIYVLTAIALLPGCKTKFYPEKPAAEYKTPEPVIEKTESYINIPVDINITDLEKLVNNNLQGVLYEDKSFTDNENDGLIVTVKKYSDIKVEAYKNAIRATLPLDVWGKYRTLGVTTEFKGVLNITYNTAITLKDDWKLSTHTWSGGHEWIKSPTVELLYIDIPVTYIADAILSGQQDDIAKEIDKAVKKNVDMKELVRPVITGLYDPVKVSEEYKSWLRMQPVEIMMSQISSNTKRLRLSLGMRAFIETIIADEKPLMADTSKFPPFKVLEEKVPEEFNVSLLTIMDYKEASKLMTELYVLTPYTYTEGKKSITLTQFDMWGTGERMVMEIGMKGSLNGFVYLTGTPYYEPKDRSIRMKDVDFHLDTKNKLIKSGNWLLHGAFRKVMQKNIYFEIGKELDATKKDCQEYFNNYEISKGIYLNGKLNELETQKVYLTEKGIVAVVNVKGKAAIKIDGLE